MKPGPILDAFDWESYERVVILSPHIDDAVLSCGALIRSLKGRVSRLVVTICCGNPKSGEFDTQNPTRIRQRKGYVSPAIRRREDIEAMHHLDCDFVHLGFADAIYRRSPTTGKLIYRQSRQKWSRPNIGDAAHVEELYLVLRRLCHNMGSILLFSPMGIGYHVDHTICAMTALRLTNRRVPIVFYEDFPYVVDEKVGSGDDDDPERALARLSCAPLQRFYAPLDTEQQAETLSFYSSQIPSLFGNGNRMRKALAARTYDGTPAEFLWRPRALERT
jgi:LmbE family N-acetylglucosaminyl deacetylase